MSSSPILNNFLKKTVFQQFILLINPAFIPTFNKLMGCFSPTYGYMIRKTFILRIHRLNSNFLSCFSVIGLMERVSGQIIVSCVKKKRKEKTENKGNGLKIK